MKSRVLTHSRYKEWISAPGHSRNDLSFSRQRSAPLTPSLLQTGPVHLPSLGFLPRPVRCLASPLTRGQSRCPLNSIFYPLMLLLSSCLFYLFHLFFSNASLFLLLCPSRHPLPNWSKFKTKIKSQQGPYKGKSSVRERVPKSTFFVNPTKLALVSN